MLHLPYLKKREKKKGTTENNQQTKQAPHKKPQTKYTMPVPASDSTAQKGKTPQEV